jgi:hypothetical protein
MEYLIKLLAQHRESVRRVYLRADTVHVTAEQPAMVQPYHGPQSLKMEKLNVTRWLSRKAGFKRLAF